MFPWETLITGVVGLAGIGGTLWAGSRSINAEDKRARLAEKRRIYAKCQASITELLNVAAVARRANRPEESNEAIRLRLRNSSVSMILAAGELFLIAPANVGKSVVAIREAIRHHVAYIADHVPDGTADASVIDDAFDRIGNMQAALYGAMRADLGESD